MKRKQFACVLISPDITHKKTANTKLIKGEAKKRKLTGASALSSLQQNAFQLKTTIIGALSAGKIIS